MPHNLSWCLSSFIGMFFFFKQKTAYEMRISDWSSDVCSSDLAGDAHFIQRGRVCVAIILGRFSFGLLLAGVIQRGCVIGLILRRINRPCISASHRIRSHCHWQLLRSEEHTSELQSLMRISYAVFCLKKKTKTY